MGNYNLTEEQIKKAREAKSPKELQELAAKIDIQITMEQAEKAYARLHQSANELGDEELDNVSGGGCLSSGCPNCGSNNLEFRGMFMQYDIIYCQSCGKTFYS